MNLVRKLENLKSDDDGNRKKKKKSERERKRKNTKISRSSEFKHNIFISKKY